VQENLTFKSSRVDAAKPDPEKHPDTNPEVVEGEPELSTGNGARPEGKTPDPTENREPDADQPENPAEKPENPAEKPENPSEKPENPADEPEDPAAEEPSQGRESEAPKETEVKFLSERLYLAPSDSSFMMDRRRSRVAAGLAE
jgi:hypothetical protein